MRKACKYCLDVVIGVTAAIIFSGIVLGLTR